MSCDCVHEKVCKHQAKIWEAMEGVITHMFPGPHKDWENVAALVESVCKHRFPKVKDGSKPFNNPIKDDGYKNPF
jgi:hypothetical protein